jgi:hypothetical protein
MTNASMTPGSRPRRGVIGVLALLGVGALTTGLVLAAGEAGDPSRVAGAVELATFASCDELAAWGAEASRGAGMALEDSSEELTATADGMPNAMRAAEGAATGGESASSGSASSGPGDLGGGDAGFDPGIQDPAAPPASTTPASTTTTPPDTEPEATDPETTEPETTGTTEPETTETTEPEGDEDESDEPADDETNRIVEGVDEIDLVDRLTEDVVLVSSASTLAVVDLDEATVVERTPVPWDAQITYDAETGVAWVVGHPDQGGVLVERYAVDTEGLESEGSWTTTGSLVSARRIGDELHVIATDGFTGGPPMPVEPLPADDAGTVPPDAPTTEAVPFAGGPVDCDEVLHPAGPSDPTATLLATLSATGAVEPVRATEVVGSGSLVHVTTGAIYLATPQWSGEATTTGIHRFDLATLEPTGSGSVEGSLLDEFSMSEHEGVLRVATTADGAVFGRGSVAVDGPAVNPIAPPAEEGDEASGPILNEIVVLDTEGALDEIGRTERFGHPGETLHGIRFAGATAYAVTFLQTDPFYVVDLSDPSDPRVVGEVELPGFSSYLHPLGDGLVVGFGPGTVRMAAKLFDVSDPTAPRVVGELDLGDDLPVAYDHHAFLDLGAGRFAVPVTSYGGPVPAVPGGGVSSDIVVVDTAGRQLVEEARFGVGTREPATRVLTVDDGWALLAGPEIVVIDGTGVEQGRIGL